LIQLLDKEVGSFMGRTLETSLIVNIGTYPTIQMFPCKSATENSLCYVCF